MKSKATMEALRGAVASPPEVRGFGERSPLHGLAFREVGAAGALAQSVAAAAPTAAALTTPVLVAQQAGQAAGVSVLAASVLVLLVGFTIGQFARRMGATGSLYSYAARAFAGPSRAGTARSGTGGDGTGGPLGAAGRAAALATGFFLIVGYGFVAMFALAGISYYASQLLGVFGIGLPRAASVGVVVLAGALVGFLLLRGVGLSARTVLVTEAVAVAVLLVPTALVLLRTDTGPATDAAWPQAVSDAGPAGIASGAVLALMAFVGFESATALGVETRRPLRTIPRVVLWSAAGLAVFHLAAVAAQLALAPAAPGSAALGPAGQGASTAGLAGVLAETGLGWMVPLLDLGAALSFFACAMACTTALVRVALTMGREGVLPPWLGRAHPRFRTPATAVYAFLPAITAVPALWLASGVGQWDSMTWILGTAATAYVAAYILACVAAPVFLHRVGELTWGSAAAALLAAAALAAALAAYLAGLGADGRLAGAALAVVLAGLGTAFALRRPVAGTRMGLYDVPTRDALLGGGTGRGR